MHDARLDPSGYYDFQLTNGSVRDRSGERVVLLPEGVLTALIASAAREGDLTPLRRLGDLLGGQALEACGEPVLGLSPEEVLGYASSITALYGWGKLSFERWGSALVVVTEGLPPVDDEALGAAALLGGIFSRLAGRQVACVPGGDQRFIVVNLDVAEKVWGWFKDGADLPTIVGQLAPGAR